MYLYIFGLLFLLFNMLSFIIMGIDKYKAKHQQYRISEKTLLISALPLASFGFNLSIHFFRHKTQKKLFTVYGKILMLIHFAIMMILFFKYTSIGQLILNL